MSRTRKLPLPERYVILPDQWIGQLDCYERAVVESLIRHINDDGFAWPSISTICRETLLGRTTVKQALARLQSYGIITIERRFSPKGVPTSSLYHVDLLKVFTRPVKRDAQSGVEGGIGRETTYAARRPISQDDLSNRLRDDLRDRSEDDRYRSAADHDPDPGEPDPTPSGGTSVCVTRARARARGEAADAAHTQEPPPRGFVLEVPRDLDWATGAIEAFWAAKGGWRTREAADHLWEQLRAIAAEGGPEAVMEQLQEGTASRWRSIDAAAWRRYKRLRGGRPGLGLTSGLEEAKQRAAGSMEAAALIRQALGMPTLEEEQSTWH